MATLNDSKIYLGSDLLIENDGGGGGQPSQGGGVIVSTVVMPNAKITLPSLIVSTEIQE